MKSEKQYLTNDIHDSTDWKVYRLGDICNITTGKLNSNAAESFGKYPFFTCSKEEYKINSYSFDCEAILLAGNNAVGDYGIKYYKGKFNAYQRTYVITIKDEEEFDYNFIFYVLKTKLGMFQRFSFGTATQYLTKTILDPVEIEAPDIFLQRRIGGILRSLDEIIENLNISNVKLEKIIQSIFKSWFIDFDRQTEFVDSKLGEIPKKFSVSRIGDMVHIITGFAFKSEKYYSGTNGVKLVRGDNVKRGNLLWRGKTRYWKEITSDLQKYVIMKNDIVIGMDGSRVGENFAYVYEYELPLLLVQRVARLRVKENFYQEFTWQSISNGAFTEYVSNIQTGSAIPHISKNQIEDFPVLLPSQPELERFQQIVESIREKISRNTHVIEIFSTIRDSLIPKLISGEIRV